MGQILVWWLIAQALGLAALPITRRVFAWLPDRGYALSKVVGLLLVSYLVWLGASGGLLSNDLGGILLAFGLVTGLSLALILKKESRAWLQGLRSFWQEQGAHILRVEVLFLLAFAGWALVRAYAPSKIVYSYGEKFMELAFLNGILNSAQFPPLDPWLAGYSISYYYFGYVMMGIVTRLSGATVTVGFELYDALLFALTACAAYGIVTNLIAASSGYGQARGGQGPKNNAGSAFGLLGAVFVAGMGNLEGVIHALVSANRLPESFLRWLAIPDLITDPRSGSLYPGHDFFHWWWWRASRVLNDLNLSYQEYGAQPISEFPFFSFLLGDNHPHKLALPFVLLSVGLALNLLLRGRQPDGRERFWQTVDGGLGSGRWLFYALALGGLGFLNTWDMPIYLGLMLLAHAAGNYRARGRFTGQDLLSTLALGGGLGVGAILLYLLFYLSFSSQAGGILPYINPPTRLVHYAIHFGPFLFALGFFLAGLVWATAQARGWGAGDLLRRVGKTWLWIVAVSYGPFLLLVTLAFILLSYGGLVEGGLANPLIQQMLGGMQPGEALLAILTARLTSPWTFGVLSLLLALGITAALEGGQGNANGPPAQAGAPALETPEPPGTAALQPAALFATLLAITGLALTLCVEFFYLRDSFGVRMNTVFKFYFQAWIMLALASAYGVWWFIKQGPGRRPAVPRGILMFGMALLTAGGLVYTGMGIAGRTHAFSYPPDLDGAATLAGSYEDHWSASPDDWAAIQWLRQNLPGVPTILEAPGGSYQLYGRISAFTGFPTLQGWFGHEYQWRGSSEIMEQRRPDIDTIFTTRDDAAALTLLQNWNVSFVILGDLERRFVMEQCAHTGCDSQQALEKFERILQPVFSQGGTTVYLVPVRTP